MSDERRALADRLDDYAGHHDTTAASLNPMSDAARYERHRAADLRAAAAALRGDADSTEDAARWKKAEEYRRVELNYAKAERDAALADAAEMRTALDCQTELLDGARTALRHVGDQISEHAYDELEHYLEDGVTDENGRRYRSELARLREGIAAHRKAIDGTLWPRRVPAELALWALLDTEGADR